MMGQKLIKQIVKNNNMTKEYEIKDFDYDYEQIAIEINDHITDDPEDLFWKGIYLDFDDYHSLDVDKVLNYIEGLIEDDIEQAKESEEREMEWLDEFVQPLKDAEGYVIYFKRTKEHYKDWKYREEQK